MISANVSLVLTLFPPDANPTAGTMNFAVVAIGAVILLSTGKLTNQSSGTS